MKLCRALPVLLLLFSFSLSAQGKPMTYPQLFSTRYASGDRLPPDFQRPNPAFDFVEKAKLPAGVKILSAARAKNGVIWVVTEQGVFRSQGAQYVPLQIPPISQATHLPILTRASPMSPTIKQGISGRLRRAASTLPTAESGGRE